MRGSFSLRDVYVAPFPRSDAVVQRRQKDDQGEPRCYVVAVWAVWAEWRAVRPADKGVEAGQRGTDVSIASEPAIWPGLPHERRAQHDNALIQPSELLIPEAP